jgi:uncharacterized protein YbaR (Trm112 family)
MIEPQLLELLVCPVTKGRLLYDRDNQELISVAGRLAFTITEGVPILVEEQARELAQSEYDKWSKQ